MPGYYGNLYRRTVKSREDLRIKLINKIKVHSGPAQTAGFCVFVRKSHFVLPLVKLWDN